MDAIPANGNPVNAEAKELAPVVLSSFPMIGSGKRASERPLVVNFVARCGVGEISHARSVLAE
ncbi:hypothetical protein [Ruegeria profundi]|uniref:hypothetical protein n=1 Tax=Ruegeria profundi TaxID=1685378 RepID=UPI00146FF0FE|nr:hypothetical protein [Ruegeria profundi]